MTYCFLSRLFSDVPGVLNGIKVGAPRFLRRGMGLPGWPLQGLSAKQCAQARAGPEGLSGQSAIPGRHAMSSNPVRTAVRARLAANWLTTPIYNVTNEF